MKLVLFEKSASMSPRASWRRSYFISLGLKTPKAQTPMKSELILPNAVNNNSGYYKK